jgi:hypothetical protein
MSYVLFAPSDLLDLIQREKPKDALVASFSISYVTLSVLLRLLQSCPFEGTQPPSSRPNRRVQKLVAGRFSIFPISAIGVSFFNFHIVPRGTSVCPTGLNDL